MSSRTPSKQLISRSVPSAQPTTVSNRPSLFKMPAHPVVMESDKAHGGVMAAQQHHMKKKQYVEKPRETGEIFDSGLGDEISQVSSPTLREIAAPVSCTEAEEMSRGSFYLFPKKAKTIQLTEQQKPPAPQPALQPAATTKLNQVVETSHKSELEDSSKVINTHQTKLLRTLSQFFVEDEDGESMLHLSVMFEDRRAVRYLLGIVVMFPMLRLCLNDQNKMNQTPLHLAASLNLPGIMEDLLTAGADMDLQDCNGNTPLHTVCRKGHLQCLDVLISNVNSEKLRITAESTNNEGFNALHLAVKDSNIKVMQRLHTIGCDVNLEDKKSGLRPLHHALRRRDALRVIRCLVECGADVNEVTYNGCTALHMAAGNGQVDQVAYLVALGADPYCRSDEGDLPIDYATNDSIINLLEKVMEAKSH